MKIGAMYRNTYRYPTYVYLGPAPPQWPGWSRLILIHSIQWKIIDMAGVPNVVEEGSRLTLTSLMAVLAISDRLANTDIPIPLKLAFTPFPRDTTTNHREYTHGVAVGHGSSTQGTYGKPS